MPASRRHLLFSLLVTGLLPAQASMAASAPALQQPGLWSDGLDPAAYLASEKYDGVRAFWDGTRLRFRSGRTVPAPDWFTARLPGVALDGELWLGRGRFDALSGIVRKERPVDAEWRQLRYLVFDLPGAPGGFAERAQLIESIVRRTAWVQLATVEQRVVADRDALHRRLAATVAQGGEGLVLHLASAPWRPGRSTSVLKFKPSLDAEATVVGHHPGRGKYAGQLGALEVRTPEGRQFLVGSGVSDAWRHDPPPVGRVITCRYHALTGNGAPRFASFLRVHDAL